MTPSDLITQALKAAGVIGVGQLAAAEDMNDCLFQLNLMMGEWSAQRLMVYHLVDTAYTSTGAVSYTVGLGGNFNVTRPTKLEAAFFRQIIPSQPNLLDFPLTVFDAREDYNRIRAKTLGSWPSIAFYDAAYPMASLYVWPVPAANNYEIHITTKELLPQVTLAQTINLPPEYQSALFWNLADRIRPLYQLPEDRKVSQKARGALATLRQGNTQLPHAEMPGELTRDSNAYNVYSDQ